MRLRGRWKMLLSGLLAIAVLIVLTASIMGADAYRSYFFTVLPEVERFRVGWNNDSVWGFWNRLFDRAPRGTARSPGR